MPFDLLRSLRAFDTLVRNGHGHERPQGVEWRGLVVTLRTSAKNFEGYEFDDLFDAIQLYEPDLAIQQTLTPQFTAL